MDELRDIETTGDSRLRYRVWPASAPRRATLVLFNGIMSNSAWFGPLAPALTAAGFELVGADRRGSGHNREGWGDASSAAVLVEDALAIIEREHDPTTPLFLVGWCWGAALSVAVGAKLGSPLAGLILITPGMFNRPALHAAIEAQRELLESADPADSVLASPIEDSMFTESPALDTFIRADPHRVQTISPRMLTVTKKLATGAIIRLRKLPAPVLVLLAEDDEATDNEATRQYFAKLPVDRVELGTVPGRHGVQFDAPTQVTERIVAFVDRHASRP